MPIETQHQETCDSLGNQQLILKQPRNGYRFSIDSLLLWGFLRPTSQSHWVDLGTGCGILAITLAKINQVEQITAVEIQPSLVSFARENIILNQVDGQIHLIEGDLRIPSTLKKIPPADGICVNPPYYKIFTGRLNKNRAKALARHEIAGTFEDFLNAGRSLLQKGGQYSTILPVSRLTEVLPLFSSTHLFPTYARFVHPFRNHPATHFLLTAVKEKQEELTLYPPLILYQSPGSYTPEVEDLMQLTPLRFP